MIEKKTVKHVSGLARIHLSEREIEEFAKELSEILDTFSKLREVDTKRIEPAFQPIEIKNIVREDKPLPSLSQEKALENAERKQEKFFKGPRAV